MSEGEAGFIVGVAATLVALWTGHLVGQLLEARREERRRVWDQFYAIESRIKRLEPTNKQEGP